MNISPLSRRFGLSWLMLGFLFLYLPIFALIVFSLNDSPIPTVWGGLTFKWFGAVLHDREIVEGFLLSLRIALATATASVVLGTLAAYALTRYACFRGRSLFSALLNTPLVMPEVIVGLSLLLMLVSVQKLLGFPERGMLTIWIGHTLLGMAYATVSIQARLVEVDRTLTDAAMDLGCRPLQVFFLVTLPLIAQAIVSAWLLTFTISLDDVVLSAFLSGPGSTTLPIAIFSRARLGLNPTINAVATLTILAVGIGVIAGSLWLARQEQQRVREETEAYRESVKS